MIIMPSHGKHYSPAILQLYLDDFPMVMIDKKLRGIPVPSVRTDNRAAAAKLIFLLRRIRKQFPSGNAETGLSVKGNG